MYGNTDRDKFEIIRLNTDGTTDKTFGTNGAVTISFTTGSDETYDQAYSVAIQTDGKIVVAGVSDGFTNDGYSNRFAVARLLRNGALDNTFGNHGKVVTQIVKNTSSNFGGGRAVTIQGNGKILVAGDYYDADNIAKGAVVRYLADGSLDYKYGNKGKVLLPNTSHSLYHHATAIAMQPNRKVIVGGYVASDSYDANAKFELTSLNTDGTPDAGFGSDGIVTATFGKSSTQQSVAYGVAVQSDGKIVEAGYTSTGYSEPRKMAVARFLSAGPAITTTTETPIAYSNTSPVNLTLSNNIADTKIPAADLKVYPNPVANMATAAFVAKGKYTLQLTDMSGKTLMLKTGTANEGLTTVSLNMSRYAAGRYILVLTDDQHHNQTFTISKQ